MDVLLVQHLQSGGLAPRSEPLQEREHPPGHRQFPHGFGDLLLGELRNGDDGGLQLGDRGIGRLEVGKPEASEVRVELHELPVGPVPGAGGVQEVEVGAEDVGHLQEVIGFRDKHQFVQCRREGLDIQEGDVAVPVEARVVTQEGGDPCLQLVTANIELLLTAPGLERRQHMWNLASNAVFADVDDVRSAGFTWRRFGILGCFRFFVRHLQSTHVGLRGNASWGRQGR